MSYNIIKDEFDKINANNDFLSFLYQRIKSDNYRGIKSAQHNRYTIEELKFLLELILEYKNNLPIPPGDSGSFPPGFQSYIDYSHKFALKFNKRNSENTIKKNIFPDLEKMQLISRKKEGQSYTFASVTPLGKIFLQADSVHTNLLFNGALNRLFDSWIDYIISILANTELNYLHEYEIMFIVSAIGNEFDYSINQDTAVDLIKSSRNLSKRGQIRVLEVLKEYLEPKKFKGNKTQKRDFHNWKNKFDQFTHLLKYGLLLEYDKENGKIKLRAEIKYKGKNVELIKKSRSDNVKKEYFTEHNIIRNNYPGFELHHIIEFSEAKSLEQIAIIDHWKNLLYIDGTSHNQITRSKNKLYIFDYDEKKITLSDSFSNLQELIYENNVAVNMKMIPEIKNYNDSLYNALFKNHYDG